MAKRKMKHCTKADAEKVLDFMVEFSKVLRLPAIWISIKDEPADESAHAEIVHEEQRQYASVYLGRDWRSLSEFQRFHAAVHETLHLTHRRIETAALVDSQRLMHEHEHEALRTTVKREIELMVDLMALAWCRVAEVEALWFGNDSSRAR